MLGGEGRGAVLGGRRWRPVYRHLLLAACCSASFSCAVAPSAALCSALFMPLHSQTPCPWPLGAGEQLGGRHASPFTTGKTTAMAVAARPSARGRPRAADSLAIVVQSVVGKNRAAEALGSRWSSQTGHELKTEALVVFAAALIRNKNVLCSWLIGHIDPLLNG